LNAFDELLPNKRHSLLVGILCMMLGFDSKNRDALKRALLKVMSTPVSIDLLHEGGGTDWEASGRIEYASMKNGKCAYPRTVFEKGRAD
jgi:hypothetical protein